MEPLNFGNALSLSASMAAKKYDLPQQLILAIIQVESGGNIYAWNPEPKYRYLWDVSRNAPFRALTQVEIDSETPAAGFPALIGDRDAEWWGQCASWGPMQAMGGVARELGFADHFPALCSTALGVEIGCRHLARLRDRFLRSHGWPGVSAAYNAGSPRAAGGGGFVNQPYVNKIDRVGGFRGLTDA